MTLLQQIINDAIDSRGDIAGLLRRCRILAQRLNVNEFKQWVMLELEGYPGEALLPDYRVIETPLILGEFAGAFGRRIKNGQVPLSSIPAKLKNPLTKLSFYEGVGAISERVRKSSGELRVPWPAEVLRHIGQGDIYEDMYLIQALRIVGVSSISGVLDQVRNRVLEFALELESRNPEAGEAIMSTPKIPADQVRTIFHTTIKGDVQNLAQGSDHFTQNAQGKVLSGDMRSLQNALSDLGIGEDDFRDLKAAIEVDGQSSPNELGPSVKGWLGHIAIKASEGVVNIASAAGVTAVTEAIKGYFGGN